LKFVQIKISNYGSYFGTVEIPLADQGLVLVSGKNLDEPKMNSNGSGKSMLFDALDWCLWGRPPRGDHADSVINEEIIGTRGGECAVDLEIEDDSGCQILVCRKRAKGRQTLQLFFDGRELSNLDSAETQREISRLLGLTREVFHGAVLFAQTDLIHYMDSSDSSRMDALTEILQLGEIDELLEKVKIRIKAKEAEKDQLERDRTKKAGILQGLELQDMDAIVESWERDRKTRGLKVGEEIVRKQQEAAWTQQELGRLTVLEQRSKELKERLAGDSQTSVCSEQIKSLDLALAEGNRSLGSLSARVTMAQSSLQKRHGLRGYTACPQCGQALAPMHAAQEIDRLERLLRVDTVTRDSLASNINEVHAARARLVVAKEESERAVNEVRREFQSVQIAIATLQGQAQLVGRLAAEIEKLRQTAIAIEWEVNPHLAKKEEHERLKEQLRLEIGAFDQQAQALERELRGLDFWAKAFSGQGLKSYILDARLQELSDAANRWMGLLTGGTIWAKFESQRQTRGKKLVNAPEVRLFRWNPDGTTSERNYESWSGGEKQRISLAIDFGLSGLIAQRAKHRYDLLIMDEIFKHLDHAGKEAVLEMLGVLAREKSSLFVVEHDSEFQDQFDRRILVTKRSRRSTAEGFHEFARQEKRVGE